MSPRLCHKSFRLLAVVWAAIGTVADRPPVAEAPLGGTRDALDQLTTMVRSAVKSATDPIVAQLDDQRTLLRDITSRLSGQDARLDSLNSRLDSLSSQFDSRLGSLGSRLDSLDSRLGSANTRLDGLSAALSSHQQCERTVPTTPLRDCSDLPAGTGTGIHLIHPGKGHHSPVAAFCDMATDGGGWTVFQRRADIQPRQDFFLNWTEYRNGFGELQGEFWWGLEKLWLMTSPLDRRYELRVDLEDFNGERRHAVYQNFGISSENDGYRMTGGNYTGDAGDSLSRHFGDRFSTKDRDQDTRDDDICARMRKGAWWYDSCHESNLNGEYLAGETPKETYGVNWKAWRGYNYSLKTVEMKIRPTPRSTSEGE